MFKSKKNWASGSEVKLSGQGVVLPIIVSAPAKRSAKLLVIARGDQFGFYKMISSKVKLLITDKLLSSWECCVLQEKTDTK